MSKDEAIYKTKNFNFILILYIFLFICIQKLVRQLITKTLSRHWKTMLKRIKDYYQNKKEVLREREKNKYRELS